MNKLVSGAYGFEIKLQSNQAKYYLPDIATLRNKRIKHIDYFDDDNLNCTPSGAELAGLGNQFDRSFITLREENTALEKIKKLPCTELQDATDRLFINKIIDMTNSYVEITGDLGDLTGYSIYFVFWYDEPQIWSLIPRSNRTVTDSFYLKPTGEKTYFNDFRDFAGKKIQNILLGLPATLIDETQGIEQSEAMNLFLTLSKDNFQFFVDVPLICFYQQGEALKLMLQNIQFDMQQSFVSDPNLVASNLGVYFNAVIDDNFFLNS